MANLAAVTVVLFAMADYWVIEEPGDPAFIDEYAVFLAQMFLLALISATGSALLLYVARVRPLLFILPIGSIIGLLYIYVATTAAGLPGSSHGALAAAALAACGQATAAYLADLLPLKAATPTPR